MATSQTRIYHIVELLPTQSNLHSGLHCVPSTWIRWQDKGCSTVLLVYPDEPWEIIEELVKIYENPGEYWELYVAQVKYTTDSYNDVIHCVNELERSVEEHSGSEVTIAETESPNCSLSPNTSLSPKINRSNTYWLAYQKWLRRSSSFADSNSLMVNRVDEIMKLKSETLGSLTDKEDDDSDDDLPCDLSISSHRVLSGLKQDVNILDRTAYNFSTSWTLKHRECSPGLVELEINTGVYIKKTELDYCLSSSKKCTQLARLLTKHIFSESALTKCVYVGKTNGRQHLRLDRHATAVIVNFVLMYGYHQGWRPSNDRSIKSAIRYQLILSKKKH